MKETIQKKGYAIGTFFGMGNVPMMECISYTGLDFVVIDTEHGPYDTETVHNLISAAEKGGVIPIVRVGDVTHKEIQRAADGGARGIIIPCLKEREQFEEAVRLAKFAPLGDRGFIKGRGTGFGNEPWAMGNLSEYMKNSNDRLLLLPQCETREALEKIEEIVKIEGIDGIFIGPFDLSIALGIPGEFENPIFKESVRRIKEACHNEGKLCMTFTMDPAEAKVSVKNGMDAVAVSIDSAVIKDAYTTLIAEVRS